MQYLPENKRKELDGIEKYKYDKLLDIIDEIGDEIFSLLNDSNSLFQFKDRLNNMVVSTREGNRFYDIIRRLVNRMTDFVRNVDEIDCDVIRQMSVKNGMTYEEIASELNCGVSKVRNLVYKCGAYKGSIPIEKYDIPAKELSDLLGQGISRKEIAKVFGCSVATINKRVQKYKKKGLIK